MVRTVVGSLVTDNLLGCAVVGTNPRGMPTSGPAVETGALERLGVGTPFDVVVGRLIDSVGVGAVDNALRKGSLPGDAVGSSFANDTLALVVGECVSLISVSNGSKPLSAISFQTFMTFGWSIKSDTSLSMSLLLLNRLELATA